MSEIEGIKKNLDIFNELKSIIKQEKSIDEKIRLISIASYFATYNHTGLFSDKFLEKELVSIAKTIKVPLQKPIKNSFLHIATSVYEFGGHTRLIDRFINSSPDTQKHSLILTKQDGKVPDWLNKTVNKKDGKILKLTGTDIEKAKKLREYASKYETIILHIHPFDVIPLLSFGTEEFKQPVIYYNHLDHLFWLGVSISDLVLDLSTEGQKLSLEKRGVENSTILPVPVECKNKSNISKKEAREYLNLPQDKNIILSIGTSDKFKPFGKYNFIEKALEIIEQIPNTIVVVIGPSKKEKIWKEAFKKSKGKIIPKGIVKKSELIYYIKSADMHLGSFPLNSSTATIEILLEEVPSICLKKEKSWDIIQQISVDIDEIVEKTKQILKNKNIDKGLLKQLKEIHCEDKWKEKFNAILLKFPMKHTLHNNFSKINTVINENDLFLYNIYTNENKLIYFRYFFNLRFKNKIKIFSVFLKHPKLKSNLKSLIYNKI